VFSSCPQSAREAFGIWRPRARADTLRALPAWRALAPLPAPEDADAPPLIEDASASASSSSSPASLLQCLEGFPLDDEFAGGVLCGARHAGAFACYMFHAR
jgi:hypothetical protein